MIEAPDVERLMAGPLGQWLAVQAGVRVAAKAKSNWRFTWSAAVLMPVSSLLTLAIVAGGMRRWLAR